MFSPLLTPIQQYNRIRYSRKGLYFIQQATLSACMTYYLILHVASESIGYVDFQFLVFGRKRIEGLSVNFSHQIERIKTVELNFSPK